MRRDGDAENLEDSEVNPRAIDELVGGLEVIRNYQ